MSKINYHLDEMSEFCSKGDSVGFSPAPEMNLILRSLLRKRSCVEGMEVCQMAGRSTGKACLLSTCMGVCLLSLIDAKRQVLLCPSGANS